MDDNDSEYRLGHHHRCPSCCGTAGGTSFGPEGEAEPATFFYFRRREMYLCKDCSERSSSPVNQYLYPRDDYGPFRIMDMATELRLMIFRNLCPKVVHSATGNILPTNLLQLNRKTHDEVSSILYGETVFEVTLTDRYVSMCGQMVDIRRDKLSRELSGLCTDKIKNLSIKIQVGYFITLDESEDEFWLGSKVYPRGYNSEEVEMYAIRETVRKFVDFFGKHALKTLSVTTEFDKGTNWTLEEYAQAVLLLVGPLQKLGNVEKVSLRPTIAFLGGLTLERPDPFDKLVNDESYVSSHASWIRHMNTRERVPPPTEQQTAVELAGRNVMEAIRSLFALYRGDEIEADVLTRFQGLMRPYYLAQVAYEDCNLQSLNNIRDELGIRWLKMRFQWQEDICDAQYARRASRYAIP